MYNNYLLKTSYPHERPSNPRLLDHLFNVIIDPYFCFNL